MAIIGKGDRVFANKNLGGGWFATVPKGTMAGVDRAWIGADRFTVKFDNQEIEEVTEDDIYQDD